MNAQEEIAELRRQEAWMQKAQIELEREQFELMEIDLRLVVMPQLRGAVFILLPGGWRAMPYIQAAPDHRLWIIPKGYKGEIGVSRMLAGQIISGKVEVPS